MNRTLRAVALRFLKIRPRSVAELKEKLLLKGFSLVEVDAVLQDLTAVGLLDDRAFTQAWIAYRLARPLGLRRIREELKLKGIDAEMIDNALGALEGDYSPQEVALTLARRRWERLPMIDPLKKKKRILDFLLRRGFDPDIAMKVLKQL